MKIPLLIQNDARDPNRAKDSWAINCFLEQDDFVRIAKRPGLILTVDATEVGDLGQGVFIWPSSDGPIICSIVDDVLWLYNDAYEIEDAIDLNTALSLTYDVLVSYTPGDRVLYTYGPIVPDGWVPNVKVVWYCIANVTGIAPNHNATAYPYWSLYPNKPVGLHPTVLGDATQTDVYPGGAIYKYSTTTVSMTDNTGNYAVVYTGTGITYNPPYPGGVMRAFENHAQYYDLVRGTVDYYEINNTVLYYLPTIASNDYIRSHLVP